MSAGRIRVFAFALLSLTLAYNVGEGVIAIIAGTQASSLVLLGFGADSFIEVAAAAAVIWRLTYRDEEAGERVERRALRFIGVTFVALAAVIGFESVLSLVQREAASESIMGLALLASSVVLMPVLAMAKLWTAAQANSPVIAAEAKETFACSFLSLTALAGLAATFAFGWWWLDAAAAALMVPWLVREGLEGVRGDACFDGAVACWCRECWYGLRPCTDSAVG